jgi:hypothetical protein
VTEQLPQKEKKAEDRKYGECNHHTCPYCLPVGAIRIIYFGNEGEMSKALLLEASRDCSARGFNTEFQFAEGPAKTQLFEHAKEWDADLILLGNSSQGFLARKVFGDVMMSAI